MLTKMVKRSFMLSVRLSEAEHEKYDALLHAHIRVDPCRDYSNSDFFRMLLDRLTDPGADLSGYGSLKEWAQRAISGIHI